ncbi:MAG: hypothetical protein IPG72_16115 [Ardenticatenales bacterium]|nr:hypothetical protein [Ardenticatenales bacterium]
MLLMQDEQIEARRWVYGLPDDVAAAHAEIIETDDNRARYKRVVNAWTTSASSSRSIPARTMR